MITPEELGQRLRQAREEAGIKQEEAAAVLGLDATAIAKIEHGKRGVGALELMRLVTLYKVSVSELLADASQGEVVHLRIAMRVGAAPDTKTAAMQQRLQQIIAADRWLRQHVQGPSSLSLWNSTVSSLPLNITPYDRGYTCAIVFRNRYGLAASPIADVAVLADEIGVLVSRLPLGDHQAPDGCSALDPVSGLAYVLINSDKPRTRRRFTIAHELGHLVLGHLHEGEMVLDETLNASHPHETEANAFAAGLLMPEEGVRASLTRLRARLGAQAQPLEWAVWLCASFGVSEEAAAYRIMNLGLPEAGGGAIIEALKAAREDSDILRHTRARLGLAPVMSDTERGVTEVGPAMRARIARALEDGLITVQQAAEMMHVPLQQAYRWIIESGLRVRDADV
ncbi:MAG TPA: XRE family transcriptional regulator [Ktedonobacteraceae bacterium]|nr:XRE family transcriptional regulator [Ktedonobacteraceae bacterium]